MGIRKNFDYFGEIKKAANLNLLAHQTATSDSADALAIRICDCRKKISIALSNEFFPPLDRDDLFSLSELLCRSAITALAVVRRRVFSATPRLILDVLEIEGWSKKSEVTQRLCDGMRLYHTELSLVRTPLEVELIRLSADTVALLQKIIIKNI